MPLKRLLLGVQLYFPSCLLVDQGLWETKSVEIRDLTLKELSQWEDTGLIPRRILHIHLELTRGRQPSAVNPDLCGASRNLHASQAPQVIRGALLKTGLGPQQHHDC